MADRKLWATSFPMETGESPKHRRASKLAAYRWVRSQVALLPALYSPVVMVWVDERDGCGWRLYERLNLREVRPDTTHQQHHGDIVMPTTTGSEVCTCDGTPSDLPLRRTISGHHATCPVEVNTARRFNANQSACTGITEA